ncbi:MAG: SEC-C metal-binding domain-containing protein, partial [Vicinamibacterales bacterium]
AQKQVEGQNFSVRKHLLEYDDVMNKQRENIYALRRELLEGRIAFDEGDVVDSRTYLMTLAEEVLDQLIDTYASRDVDDADQWDLEALKREAGRIFGIDPATMSFANLSSDEIRENLWTAVTTSYEEKEKIVGREVMQRVERDVMLQVVDAQWKDHLYGLDHLKDGIGLRGYGQRDPLVEYKKESFDLFQGMKERIDEEIVRYLCWLRPVIGAPGSAPVPRRPAPRPSSLILNNPEAERPSPFGGASAPATAPPPQAARPPQPARVGGDDAGTKTVRRDEPKVGRNDPCPCGSGKKYKKCHGAAA